MSSIIVKKQHVLPSHSIKRFCGLDGNVEVLRKETGKVFRAKPNNDVFSVRRAWDQAAEKSFGKHIEDEFQCIVEKLIFCGGYEISSEYQRAITRFFALWKYRSFMDMEDRLFADNSKLTPTVANDAEKARLDELQIHYVDESGSFPSRNIRGFELCGQVMMFERLYNGLTWHLVASPNLELIVPDTPDSDFFIPITPSQCLIAGRPVPELSLAQSTHANMVSYLKAKKIVFGRAVGRYS